MKEMFSSGDLAYWREVKVEYEKNVAISKELLRSEPGRRLQARYSMLAEELRILAVLKYILSVEFADIQKDLSASSDAWLRLYECRHLFEPDELPITTDRLDKLGEVVRQQVDNDYSLTCSANGYLAVMVALASGRLQTAKYLAAQIWDPSNAAYVRKKSSYCTPNDQYLAYALREYFRGEHELCLGFLRQIHSPFREDRLAIEEDLLRGIVTNDSYIFLNSIDDLITWCNAQAKKRINRRNVELALCFSGIGFCRMAIEIGLITMDDVPPNCSVLPSALLALPLLD